MNSAHPIFVRGALSVPAFRFHSTRRRSWRDRVRANVGGVMLGLMLFRPVLQAAEPALAWSDEFNQPTGSPPEASRWVYDLGGSGWGNNELETYTADRANASIVLDPAAVDGHALAIRALRTVTGGYTSARLKTSGKFSFTYGRVEARMKLPFGRGIWPAFWLLGDTLGHVDWPACGEIDIMEQLGHDPGRVHGTLHGPGYSGANGPTASTVLPDGASLSDAYHTYAIDWTPGRIEWSLDGIVYSVRTAAQLPADKRWVYDGPMFLLLNLAVGGNWPGRPDSSTTFPQVLLVDYVRVYERRPDSP